MFFLESQSQHKDVTLLKDILGPLKKGNEFDLQIVVFLPFKAARRSLTSERSISEKNARAALERP